MLIFILPVIISCIPAVDFSTTSGVYYREFRSTVKFMAFRIPVSMACLIGPKQEREARQILKEVHSIVLVVLPQGNDPVETLKLGSAMHSGLIRSGYPDMISIVQSGQKIHVNVLEREGRIREMVMIIASDNDVVFIRIEGNISWQNFANFVNRRQFAV